MLDTTTETARLNRNLALNAAEILDTLALAAATGAQRLRIRAATATRPPSAHPPQRTHSEPLRLSEIAHCAHDAQRAWRLK